jgi:hypothetical protein
MESKVITFEYDSESSTPPRKKSRTEVSRTREKPSSSSSSSSLSSSYFRTATEKKKTTPTHRLPSPPSKRAPIERKRREEEEERETEEGKEEKKTERRRHDTLSLDRACLAEIVTNADTLATGDLKEPKDAPEWEPTPLEPIDWATIDANEEPTTDRSYCFLCLFSQSTADGTNPYFVELMQFIDTNHYKMDLLSYLQDIQDMYNEHLRPTLIMGEDGEGRTKPQLPWYKSMIHKHLTMHAPTRHFIVETNLKRTLLIQQQLCESGLLLMDKKSGKTTVDKSAIRSFVEVVKLGESLIQHANSMRASVHF